MALDSMKEIFDRMEQEGKPFWEIVLETDMDERQVTRNQSMAKMLITWQAMADAADSYTGRRKSVSGLVGGDGMKMRQYCLRGEAMSGGYVSEVIAEALSMAESNACMCRIVAAPTAGACGVLPAVLLLFGHNFLLAFGASENTIEYADSYLNIYALGTLFVELTLGMNAFITAQGFATTGMLTVLIGAVCNIVLDPIFIFGLNMGVRGAALATVLSQGISCVWVVSFLMGKKTSLRLKPQNMRIDMKLLAPCIALGLSTFIMQSTESIISVCFNSSLLKYGGDIAVGAMTILTSVMQFAMLPLQGLAQGAQPISSYNFGAKNAERVKQTFFALLKASLTYSVILWACIMLFPQAFAGIFTPDQELLAFTAKALRIYCGALFIFGIQIACQMTFVSIGNAPCSIIVAILRKFVLLIPLIFILPHILPDQTMAVYTAEPAADTLAVIFTMVMFGTQFKKALKKLNEA